ncbi:Uncharacterised protein [Klebsiella pneumoniae]|nr:Uncharacterised protein [Klebsiella pneumoniae]
MCTGDDELYACGLCLLLGQLQRSGPFHRAKGRMHDNELLRRDDLKQIDEHRLAVFAARMVGDKQRASSD